MSAISSRTYTDEIVKGWVGSILFHLILLIIFYFAHVQESHRPTGFVEVAIGGLAEEPPSATPEPARDIRAGAAAPASAPIVVKQASPTRVDLPERKFPVADEVLRLPTTKKIEVSDESGRRIEMTEGKSAIGEKEVGAGKSLEGEKRTGEGKRGTAGEGAGFPGSPVGADIGRAAGYSLQWTGGGTRNKISGDLPTYPEGVNIEAQVRIEAVVAVDGSVKSLHPIQKANEKLENAAMAKVRFWRFEPLNPSQPQVDQTCTITFNFKLQ
jgi:TonB family protein